MELDWHLVTPILEKEKVPCLARVSRSSRHDSMMGSRIAPVVSLGFCQRSDIVKHTLNCIRLCVDCLLSNPQLSRKKTITDGLSHILCDLDMMLIHAKTPFFFHKSSSNS